MKNIAIIGASGGIGAAFVNHFAALGHETIIHAFSRSQKIFESSNILSHFIDFEDESSIEQAAHIASEKELLDLVIVTSGFLHNENIKPEKSLNDMSKEKFERVFAINTIGPALVMKHFLPKLHRNQHSVFAALSARVGSISDNHLGGWYAYRASKAALNMLIKNASIERARRCKETIIVGLHPGTVDTPLSQPFQLALPGHQLFTPEYAVTRMIEVLSNLTPTDTGKCFAYDASEILP